MELVVHKINGEKTERKVQLSESVFGQKPNDHAIYLDTKQYLANQRQGTHKAKTRAEIKGSTRKIKKQKGTGTARAGSIKNPLFRGGGRVFALVPRDYGFKVNKKVKVLARKSALAYMAMKNKIVVLEDFSFEAPKTKQFVEILDAFKVNGNKNLFVMPAADKNVVLSSRNVQDSYIITAGNLNTYEILKAKNLFILESSLPALDELLG